MPFHRDRYPADWREISKRIRARGGGRCECTGQCGLHHGRRCIERNHEPAKWARGMIVLTVAHIVHGPDCSDGNLLAMCQRCHLRMDHSLHMAHAKATRKARSKQTELDL
jgi:hypothetical protein